MLDKRLAWVIILLALSAGCSSTKGTEGRSNKESPTDSKLVESRPVQSSVMAPGFKNSAASLGLAADQVLNWTSFLGGTVGDEHFSGGHVLLWESEPGRLTVQASLDRAADGWKPTNVTAHLVTGKDRPLYVSAALLNDVADNERRVPLWAFFGKVNVADIKVLQITFPGVPTIWEDVHSNGTWLCLYQGLIHLGPPHEGVVVALDGQGKELGRQNLILR